MGNVNQFQLMHLFTVHLKSNSYWKDQRDESWWHSYGTERTNVGNGNIGQTSNSIETKLLPGFYSLLKCMYVPLATATLAVWRCGVPLWPIDLSYLFHGEKPVLESDMLLINWARQCKMSLLMKSGLKKAKAHITQSFKKDTWN